MATMDTRVRSELAAPVPDQAGSPTWGSDLVLDLLRLLDIEYASVLPGSSFRGIHDSAVNYTANTRPELILCNHEMITVSLARGYARATGKPMAAIIHNVVGLLNAGMTIYDAWCDRVPVLILGGTGPMNAAHRRPGTDWHHTANIQGNFVRDVVKWDDQPAGIEAVPESLLRAYRMAVSEPAGPVYVCFDVDLQEQRLTAPQPLPDVSRYRPAPPPEPDRGTLREAARQLVAADLPLCFAGRVGVSAASVRVLVELAELLAIPVVDLSTRTSFPTPHALDFHGMQAELLSDADVVLGLDVMDLDGAMRRPTNYLTREAERVVGKQPTVIAVSMDELAHRAQTADFNALQAVDLPMLSNSQTTLPLLLEECRALLDPAARQRVEQRRQVLAGKQAELRARLQARNARLWDRPEITEVRMVAELWEAVRDEDFIFTPGRIRRMAPGIMNIPGPERHLGAGGAGAVGAQLGVAIGAALGLKGTGKVPVAIVGDGEMFGSIQALWTAAHYEIPLLVVVNNNRTYYNDENHQDLLARFRQRPVENKTVAMSLDRPAIDFAAIARTLGLSGEGPLASADELQPAFRRAIERVKQGVMAVVDVRTEKREHA